MADKLWGGRFQDKTADAVEDFTSSLPFDRRLYRQDIAGSQAHARMLARQGILTEEEAAAIVQGLEEIRQEIESGGFTFDPALEDIHTAIETRLTEKIGDAGRKLHTARSRNDQVALDVRLYLAEEVEGLLSDLTELRRAGARLARRYFGVIMPGYTHLQRAQPVLFAHHLLAYDEMWRRDQTRLAESLARIRVSPLGAAALAGTTFPIDPQFTARELGFPEVFRNSLDAVSDRDFILEFLAHAAILMVHLSRLAEELILWSSAEFGFVEIADAYATGSSIMPQKKNPDVAELIRGKAGRVAGHLLGLLMTVKLRPERLQAALRGGFLSATDLADYLVHQGVPFRTAHEQAGRLVGYAEFQGKELWELTLEEIQRFASQAGPDIFEWLKIENVVARRTSPGGTAPTRVEKALRQVEKELGL
ncbi:MAG: argininosuccinate lyase [Deltaproteobacteria bacterium]|nr:argininosuccinate lyase [Deltaproteobacteria bacterium]